MIETAVFNKQECSTIIFHGNDKIQNDLTHLKLNLYHKNSELSLNVSLADVQFISKTNQYSIV